jgi:hypothetical protein
MLLFSCTIEKENNNDYATTEIIQAVLLRDEMINMDTVYFEIDGVKYCFNVVHGNNDNITINLSGEFKKGECPIIIL